MKFRQQLTIAFLGLAALGIHAEACSTEATQTGCKVTTDSGSHIIQIPAEICDSFCKEAPPLGKSSTEHLQILGNLIAGNQRFVQGKPIHPNQSVARLKELREKQSPDVALLSCSDSRTTPEIIFDGGLGDFFPVRVAGHVGGDDQVASLDFGILLQAKILIVKGHEGCGAIKKTLTGAPLPTKHLEQLATTIRKNICMFEHCNYNEMTLREPVMAHVVATIQTLLEKSEALRDAVKEDRVLIAPAFFHFDTGKVEFFDPVALTKPQ